jgi:hypothetical protein
MPEPASRSGVSDPERAPALPLMAAEPGVLAALPELPAVLEPVAALAAPAPASRGTLTPMLAPVPPVAADVEASDASRSLELSDRAAELDSEMPASFWQRVQ